MPEWQKLESSEIFNHPRIVLIEDTVQLPGGETTQYLRYTGKHYVDFPTIIAIREDGNILITEEHAYPYNGTLLQFPEGLTDAGEDLATAADRELLEETGYKANSMTRIGDNLSEHRRTTTRQIIYLAEGLEKVAEAKGDLEEGEIKTFWMSEDEIWKLIAEGKIIQKNTLAAWSIYQAYKKAN